MKKEVRALNLSFFALVGDYYENRELMTGKQRDYITARLFDLYKEEYMRLCRRCEIESKREDYAIKLMRAKRIPRPWKWYTFWRKANKAAKLFNQEIAKETERQFKELEAKINAEPAQAESTEQRGAKVEVPELGDGNAPIGADRVGTSSQKRGQASAATDGGQELKPTNVADKSGEEAAPKETEKPKKSEGKVGGQESKPTNVADKSGEETAPKETEKRKKRTEKGK